jgi:hypothetical protein
LPCGHCPKANRLSRSRHELDTTLADAQHLPDHCSLLGRRQIVEPGYASSSPSAAGEWPCLRVRVLSAATRSEAVAPSGELRKACSQQGMAPARERAGACACTPSTCQTNVLPVTPGPPGRDRLPRSPKDAAPRLLHKFAGNESNRDDCRLCRGSDRPWNPPSASHEMKAIACSPWVRIARRTMKSSYRWSAPSAPLAPAGDLDRNLNNGRDDLGPVERAQPHSEGRRIHRNRGVAISIR